MRLRLAVLEAFLQWVTPEFWIANLEDDVLEVYREPAADSFKSSLIVRRSELVFLLAYPETRIPTSELLG